MKLYSFQPAPNPRRTRIFLAEKGLDIPIQEVDLRASEQYGDAYRAVNPACTVPTLELDDGTRIGDSMAICEYIETLHPEPPLLGASPTDRAQVTCWVRRIELEGFSAIAESLRNASEFFEDRALPGPYEIVQIPELAARGRDRAVRFFDMLEQRMSETESVAGVGFSFADITGFIAVEFAGWIKLDALAGRPALQAWHRRIAARPTVSA